MTDNKEIFAFQSKVKGLEGFEGLTICDFEFSSKMQSTPKFDITIKIKTMNKSTLNLLKINTKIKFKNIDSVKR